MPSKLTYILVLFVGLFLLLEARTLFQRREFKELIVASLLLALGIFYGMDYAMEWQLLPNPNILLKVLKPASETFDKFFQTS